jgi:hypothetical protein
MDSTGVLKSDCASLPLKTGLRFAPAPEALALGRRARRMTSRPELRRAPACPPLCFVLCRIRWTDLGTPAESAEASGKDLPGQAYRLLRQAYGFLGSSFVEKLPGCLESFFVAVIAFHVNDWAQNPRTLRLHLRTKNLREAAPLKGLG